MHYTVKEGISADLVADAESLMREFYRADKSINNLDQNNIKSASINYDTTYDPSKEDTCKRGTTRTHLDDASGILFEENLASPTGPVQNKWGYTSALSFNIPVSTPFSIYASGQFYNLDSNLGPLRADVRILVNGEVIGVPQNFSGSRNGTTANIEVPFFVSATALLPSGDCSIKIGFRQYQETIASINIINLAAIGYTR